jgi:thymidylate synthase (FAD)
VAVKLVGCTAINPSLQPEDLLEFFQGTSTFQENLIEFSGRVCYRSTESMGRSKGFLAARMNEGHEDIVEHVVVCLEFPYSDSIYHIPLANKYAEVQFIQGNVAVSANLRVWRDIIFNSAFDVYRDDMKSIFMSIAPNIFSGLFPSFVGQIVPLPENLRGVKPEYQGQAKVTLLGYSECPHLPSTHSSATFLFEGISRACTHQLVRHRLASFSQESQRYVELSKGGWNAVVPPSIASNPVAMNVMSEFWMLAEEKYEQLRDLGIRKEDARFLLPNATETRIVVTMNCFAWSHFFWLRALDRAAQWEIRAVAQSALSMLYSVLPDRFTHEWFELQSFWK